MNHLAELISLGVTVPAMYFSMLVVLHWRKEAFKAIDSRYLDSTQWFIVGVVISFLGGFLDQGYWTIPWSLKFLNSDLADFFFYNGVYANIIFRQTFDLVAAYCHVKSIYLVMNVPNRKLTRHFIISTLLGVAFMAVLVYNT